MSRADNLDLREERGIARVSPNAANDRQNAEGHGPADDRHGHRQMTGLSRNETAIAVRELVLSLVGLEVQVSVYVDRVLPREDRSAGPVRTMGPGGARVFVEMIGPDGLDLARQKPLAAKSEAHAWCNEEILSAVRRAVERIMRAHPDWRRRPH